MRTTGPTTSDPATGTARTSTVPAAPQTPPRRVRRRRAWGIRARILFWSILTLAVTVAVSVLAIRAVLIGQTNARIDEALSQEASELRLLADGRDPNTGEPFRDTVADVERIFGVFLQRNVPQRNEAYLTFTQGEPYRRRIAMAYRIDRDQAFLDLVRDVRTTVRSSYDTPQGAVEFLAVPVTAGDQPRGVFVAAYARDLEIAEIREPTLVAAAEAGVLMLVISSLVIWRVAESVLRPVRRTTETVREITTADLTQRLPVSGNDEVAELGRTFNDLLAKLEDAFETQRRFVDDAGHELRTPITIVRGHLELLDDDPAERARTLALVGDELERMQRIVNDLLTLAKVERPDFLSFDAVDLSALTDELANKVKTLGDRAWDVDARARGVVIADRQRLSQAMLQLAQNAVQHTARGGVIALGSRIGLGGASLWVRDTGEGIPADELDGIFGRFARSQRPRASDGAGLGLAIVRGIAEAHGGRVDVESAVGVGSTFTLVIPIDQPPRDAEGEAT
ncbi:MAG TPA: HAMP domain-containing sensor histidine kinase [Actinomycetota bacterium]|nr:HAMP domain-containing sensor histidine kinase [Actinomycetota bacterium]